MYGTIMRRSFSFLTLLATLLALLAVVPLASVLAPLLVGLLALSPILPWIVVTVVALAGGIGILLLARHLPAAVVRPAL